MNGGMAGSCHGGAGQSAYENGFFEGYASDIMERMLDLAKKYGNVSGCLHRSIPPPPRAPIQTVDISTEPHDLWTKGRATVSLDEAGGVLRRCAEPTAVFHGIEFNVIIRRRTNGGRW